MAYSQTLLEFAEKSVGIKMRSIFYYLSITNSKKNKINQLCIWLLLNTTIILHLQQMRLLKSKIFIFFLSFFFSLALFAQTSNDRKDSEFPYVVGNIAFAVDSLETVVGDVRKGQDFDFSIEIKNIGDRTIAFRDGKSNRFVDLSYSPNVLKPGERGLLNIKFEVVRELPPGEMAVEIAVESDDKKSPFKFLYLIANISEDPSLYEKKTVIDTVPRLIFEHLNYDFGHMKKGKTLYHAFLFTNMGAQDLEISEIITTPGCKVVGWPEEITPSEENGSIILKLWFLANYGVQHHTITILSNDPINPEIVLGVHGTVYQKSATKRNPDFCNE